jgi:carbonic anhydrase
LKLLHRMADAGTLGELDYSVDVDVTAESCVPDVVVVGHVRCGQDRFAVVVECKTGVEKVGGRLVKKYVGRVCR